MLLKPWCLRCVYAAVLAPRFAQAATASMRRSWQIPSPWLVRCMCASAPCGLPVCPSPCSPCLSHRQGALSEPAAAACRQLRGLEPSEAAGVLCWLLDELATGGCAHVTWRCSNAARHCTGALRYTCWYSATEAISGCIRLHAHKAFSVLPACSWCMPLPCLPLPLLL